MAFAGPANTGSFISSTNVWDPSEIYASNLSPELKEILVRMYQNLGLMSGNINLKDTGYYPTQEFVNGQLFYPNPTNSSATSAYPAYRQVYRTVVNFGALPNAGAKTVAHNIPVNIGYTFTRIYATATQPNTFFIPIPYSSATLINNIEIFVDPTNVTIVTAIDYSAYTVCYAILEYIKS